MSERAVLFFVGLSLKKRSHLEFSDADMKHHWQVQAVFGYFLNHKDEDFFCFFNLPFVSPPISVQAATHALLQPGPKNV